MLIITSFLLSVSGCGYKADPYYQKPLPQGDKNIEFHIQKQKFDTNESCN